MINPVIEGKKEMNAHYKKWSISTIALTIIALLTTGCPAPVDLHHPHDVDQLADGSILVTDGGNLGGDEFSKVICISRDKQFLWVYDEGLAWAHNADLQENGNMIISDTHHNRVIEVDSGFNIVWNTDEVEFSDGQHLRYPNDANIIADDHVLITDRNNHRIIETDRDGNILWQFGVTGVSGSDLFHLNAPHNADRLENGNTIICDSNNNRILEATPIGGIVWRYEEGLAWPRDADRLPNGNTLITDTNNMRVFEVAPDPYMPGGVIVWSYEGLSFPYDADRLDNGNTLMADLMNRRIIEVNEANEIIWEYHYESSL